MKKSLFLSNSLFKLVCILIITTLLVFSSFGNQREGHNYNHLSNFSNNMEENLISLGYTPHVPIEIDSDSDFSSYGFPGAGSEVDPYIIEGYIITNTTEDIRCAISIIETTKHFVIRDCFIDSGTQHSGGFGIRILDASEGTVSVISNTIINNYLGVLISGCKSSTASNNLCLENAYAMELSSSSQSTVNNNTCINGGDGIELSRSSDSIVFDNVCENNYGVGIEIYGTTENCHLYDNTLKENEYYGITLHIDSSKNIVYRNNFVDNNMGGTSQAEDGGKRNKWYNAATEEGNHWSDLGDECKYTIDGRSKSKDLYPLSRAETCPNPKAGSTLSIVIPILTVAAILSFIIPKYIIPFHREKNLWISFKRFIYQKRKAIYVFLGFLFAAGAFVLFRGWFLYAWTGDIGPSLISGAVICSSIAVFVIILGIFKSLNPKKEIEIEHEQFK